MLKTYVKIGLTWAIASGVVFGSVIALPHRELGTLNVLAGSFDLLISVCCFFVAVKEIKMGTSLVFTYAGVFFLFTALLWPAGALVGRALIPDDPFVNVYWNQYHWAIYFFMLLFVVVFGTLEVATRKLEILHKSLLSLLIAGIPFLLLYYPFFLNPKYLYTIPEVRDFAALNQAVSNSEEIGGGVSEMKQLAITIDFPNQSSSQTFEQKYQRVAKVFPYLDGDNYVLLVNKPTYQNALYMSLTGLAVLLGMLGFCYKNDWPKSAYLEKVLIAFIPVCVLECIHAYSFLVLVDYEVFQVVFGVGTILTRISYACVMFFVVLRLKFISSPAGSFYESKLDTDPYQVSRWRDSLDEFIIRRFLDPKKLGRRLFFIRHSPE